MRGDRRGGAPPVVVTTFLVLFLFLFMLAAIIVCCSILLISLNLSLSFVLFVIVPLLVCDCCMPLKIEHVETEENKYDAENETARNAKKHAQRKHVRYDIIYVNKSIL